MGDYSSDEDVEKEELRRLFDTIDDDGSGHISKEEFIDAVHNNKVVKKFVSESHMLRKMVARKNFDDAFRKMDTDDGGEVTFVEFWKFMQQEADERNIRKLFKAIDKDGSKKITKDELIWAFHNQPEVKEFAMKSHILRPLIENDDFDEAFKAMDRDGQEDDGHGEVDIHEFFRFCKRMAAKAEIARLKSLGVKSKKKQDMREIKMRQDALRRYCTHKGQAQTGGSYTISIWPSSYGVGL